MQHRVSRIWTYGLGGTPRLWKLPVNTTLAIYGWSTYHPILFFSHVTCRFQFWHRDCYFVYHLWNINFGLILICGSDSSSSPFPAPPSCRILSQSSRVWFRCNVAHCSFSWSQCGDALIPCTQHCKPKGLIPWTDIIKISSSRVNGTKIGYQLWKVGYLELKEQ